MINQILLNKNKLKTEIFKNNKKKILIKSKIILIKMKASKQVFNLV
jgi:hypothetical protein